MRKLKMTAILSVIVLGIGAVNLSSAHHSAVAFDKTKTQVVKGKVTRFIWRNPHLSVTLDVTADDGSTEEWRIEGGSTREMVANGFDRESLQDGDEVTVLVNPLKSGEVGGLMQGLTLADGKSFGMDSVSYATAPANPLTSERKLPSLTEYVPPPAGETWQKREARTRPAELPMPKGRVGSGDTPGALDPQHLAKPWPKAPFDMTGTWDFRGEVAEQAHYGQYEFKPHPEFTEKSKKIYAEYQEYARAGKRYIEPTAFCYPAGMPRLMTRYGALMILQYPTAIFIMSRLNNEYRVIFLDGREREPENIRDKNWSGESLGHWEGDTLVIETEGFTDENHLIQQGIFAGDQLKITERYTMLNDGNTIKMDFIMTDPEHWIGEWRHTKFRDRLLNSDVREANCLFEDNEALPGMRPGA
jgi:hypothetical protein